MHRQHVATRSVSGRRRAARRAIRPNCETLERRTVLNGTSVSIALSPAALKPAAELGHAHAKRQHPIGTISGTVTNSANNRGLPHVRVQLIDSDGDVIRNTVTGVRGRYAFRVAENGAYVVREITPRRFSQTSPTFTFTEPTGDYATDPATGEPYDGSSYSYATGNSDPANGPVGPYSWDTVAPAGNLPFESPININARPSTSART